MSPDARGELERCRVIVPMKPLPYAKMRLRDDLPVMVCDALVLYMLKAVLRALEPWRAWRSGATSFVVLGGDEPVRRIAEEAGADWAPEKAQGLNGALAAAMQDAFADGLDAALYLPGDVPFVQQRDIREITRAGRKLARPVGVPADYDGGTNALLIPAGLAMTPELGPNSYAKHRAAAKRAGTKIRTMKLVSVMFDVDTYEDFMYLLWRWPGFESLLQDWEEWLLDGMNGPSPSDEFPWDAVFYWPEEESEDSEDREEER